MRAPSVSRADSWCDGGVKTSLTQWLMRTEVVPAIYQKYWRPALGRVAKGVTGPSMAGEKRLAVELLDLRPGRVVLDVACGTGAFTRHFAGVVGRDGLAVGLDFSPTMLARARVAGGRYVRCDATRMPVRPATVDAVCCFAALHMFDDPEAALRAFGGVLKPGGRLALLTTARHAWEPARTVDGLIGRVTGQRMFDRAELRGLLEAAGFTDVTSRVHGLAQFVGATYSGSSVDR